jgi:hypothetical protein
MIAKTSGKFGEKLGGKGTGKRKEKCFLFKNMRGKTKIEEYERSFLIYIQQDATLHSLFYLKTALHILGGNTIHHQKRKQIYLQHLVFVTPLLLPAAIAACRSNGVTNTRCCRYSCLRS